MEPPPTMNKVLYRGRLVTKHIQEAPAIVSFFLVKDWTPTTKTNDFCIATEKVIDANPILTSSLKLRGSKEMLATQNTYKAKELFHVVPRPEEGIPMISSECMTQRKELLFNDLEKNVLPHFPEHISGTTRLGRDEVVPAKKIPVFEVYVMELQNNHACIAVAMSHCIGDGSIYFQVVEQLNEAMTKRIVETKINWDGYDKLPEIMPKMVPHPLTVAGFILGSTIITPLKKRKVREPTLLLLSKTKIQQKKKELVGEQTDYLTSNDVILSALSEATIEKAAVQAQYANLRSRLDGLQENDAGNYLGSYLMDAKMVASNPNIVRKVTATGKNNITPLASFLPLARGKLNRNTNFTQIAGNGFDNTIAFFPSKGRLRSRIKSKQPGYFTTIFEFDHETIGVLSTYPLKKKQQDESNPTMLQSLLVD